MVQESAGGAILRPTAPTTFGQAGGGTGIKIAGQGQEACAQAPVAQGDGAEFVFGPIHRQGRRERWERHGCGSRQSRSAGRGAQHRPKVWLQRLDPDDLLAPLPLMGGILPAAALSQTDGLPVGRRVTDPGKASAFHERFYQHRAIAVTGLPIGGQAVERLGQAMGCQIGHLQMSPDEKTTLVDHAVQIFGPHNVAPTQPLIAGCQAPGGGAEGQPAEITVRAGDEVTQLRATERTSPQIMFLFEEFAPGAAWCAAAWRNQLQCHRTQLVE